MRLEPPAQLVAALERLGLAAAADFARVNAEVARLTRELPPFDALWIDALARARVLTPFQAAELHAGRGEALRVGPFVLCRPLAATADSKMFRATYKPAGGVIRVVLVKEAHAWFPFFCTDPLATPQQIIEAFADRATIEQDFHDVKEVWGAGQQQVRNIWTNVATYHLCLWMHTLVEFRSWHLPHHALCDRSASPWDDPERRPSHADRRKALRRHILHTEFSAITAVWSLPRKLTSLARRLMALAT